MNAIFKPISHRLATATVIAEHYAHVGPSISWAFGMYVEDQLSGVLTVGCSGYATGMRRGVCGPERRNDVFELNRFWVSDSVPIVEVQKGDKIHKNGMESSFIGWCLRTLRHERPNIILVSYADTAQGHRGVIYQATNWLYTGMPPKSKDIVGDKRVERSRKHRYVWFANTRDRKLLRWEVLPYPKPAAHFDPQVSIPDLDQKYGSGTRIGQEITDIVNV